MCEAQKVKNELIMNYFPTYLALGSAFCNRHEELNRLTMNIKNNNPSLLISPRRYGKTSLALNALEGLKWPYAYMDFYKELSEEEIEKAILGGIGKLLGQLEPISKRLMALASDFFASMQVRVVLEKPGITLDFSRRKRKAADTILEALEKLQQYALKKEKRTILFMDEFQVLGEVTQNYSIEAAIREAVQKSSHVAYVFSGSNRHLMNEMFYDKKRPFYKLCDLITLDRISEKDYEGYIQKAALETWNKKLSEDVLATIFQFTERHSYYVNKLCSLLWLGDYPNKNTVSEHWEQYSLENKSMIEREIELLSFNQRKLLIFLAEEEEEKELFSKSFAAQLNMSLSSIARALAGLNEKDYLYKNKEGYYRIMDPLVKTILTDSV